MNPRHILRTAVWIFMAFLGIALVGAPAKAQSIEVTVTNLTAHTVLTPIVVATHRAGVKLFTLGQPASTDLEWLAEAGNVAPLEATLSTNPNVLEVKDTGAVLPPGKSATTTLNGGGTYNHPSLAAMLVPTNDGFFALNDVSFSDLLARVQGGPGSKMITFYSPAYDAGTEADDELCSHVPGPPTVCTGEGFNASRSGDVDFVHVHPGIRGVGDLSAAMFDWKNPVAKIVVKLVTE
jgi:hypothetical protein